MQPVLEKCVLHKAMSSAPEIAGKDTNTAHTQLVGAGWREIAQGDWSWVLAAPDDETVVRLTPWDDAYKLHAENCIANAGHPHLPRIDTITPLAGDGYAVFMERLYPVEIGPAETFCAALGFPRNTDKARTTPDPAEVASLAAQPHVKSLSAILGDLFVRAGALPFFGGSDIRPGNLLQDARGTIKVIDPIFVAGPKILAAIEAGDGLALRAIPLEKLLAFLTIAAFQRPPGTPAETEALRARLLSVY